MLGFSLALSAGNKKIGYVQVSPDSSLADAVRIIAINPETREIRSGQIAGHKGFDYCILKFGDAERSSAELEMAYYKMARAAGISMMPCRIIEIEGQKHFITHRFDRDEERKLHMHNLSTVP